MGCPHLYAAPHVSDLLPTQFLSHCEVGSTYLAGMLGRPPGVLGFPQKHWLPFSTPAKLKFWFAHHWPTGKQQINLAAGERGRGSRGVKD